MTPTWTKSMEKGLTVLCPEDKFNFTCHAQLLCYTRCCRDVTIFLTPYDILRMKRALGLTSSAFLSQYTLTMMGDAGLPVVVLRMQDDEARSCPFVTDTGCCIYADRPWSCRIYPLQPEVNKITEKSGKAYYSIFQVPFCQGLASGRMWILKDWIKQQGIEPYRRMERLFEPITSDERLKHNKISNSKIQEMYYMACYDLDRFRRFVLESSFLKRFEVSPEQANAIVQDDEALYRFAIQWLKYGLLSGKSLKIKPEVMVAKKQELGIK